jgi:hypothetical protein
MACISPESPSCEVPYWILLSVVYRDVTRQAKGLHRLKYVGALEKGLAYLSRCNSGWFCHIYSRFWLAYSTTRNERQTVASEQPIGVPSVWVRFTLQGLKFDSESSVSCEDWDCLILLPHRVTRAIIWWVILRYAVKGLYLAWVVIGAYLFES